MRRHGGRQHFVLAFRAAIHGCETIPVEVRVNDVTDLYAVDVKVAFDPSVLEVVDADPAKPGIQVQDGGFLVARLRRQPGSR